MWCGELEHPHFPVPPSVHINGDSLDIISQHDNMCDQHVVVRLLASGELGGPSDEECLWHIGAKDLGDTWRSLDWAFPTSYGSRTKLSCLLRYNTKNIIEVALPVQIRPDAPRPKVCVPFKVDHSDVIILLLHRCELLSRPSTTYKLGTSIQRAAAGTLKEINKCMKSCFPRCDSDPWELDASDQEGDKVVLRVWHLRGAVSLTTDAMRIMFRLRVAMHNLYKGNPVLNQPQYLQSGWLRDMIEMEEEHYEETRLADALDDLMDTLHELGFNTVFMNAEQGQIDLTYKNEPFSVYSTSICSSDIARVRRLRMEHISHPPQTSDYEAVTEVLRDKDYNDRFIKLAFQVRTARIRSTMSSKLRVRKHRDVSIQDVRFHRLEHASTDIESIFPVVNEPDPKEGCVLIPSKGMKQLGRRLGVSTNKDRTGAIAEQEKVSGDVTVLRLLRLEAFSLKLGENHVSMPDTSGGTCSIDPTEVLHDNKESWTESWVKECRLARFTGAAQVRFTSSQDSTNHHESKPVGLVRKDMSEEELEMLMILREQSNLSARQNLWTENRESVQEVVQPIANFDNGHKDLRAQRLIRFDRNFRL